ncbi:ATP-NAD kinase, partial [Aeromicrobium phragmitis]
IGLSSIAGLLCPSPRSDAHGVVLHLAPSDRAPHVVHAPIAPGLVVPVGVESWQEMTPGTTIGVTEGGVIAVDGEREVELRAGDEATVTLRATGPRAVDVPRVMAEAARLQLLARPSR